MASKFSIHPGFDNDLKCAAPRFTGGTLRCHCAKAPVEVTVSALCA